MAGQPGSTSSALPAAAHVVGNAFVSQYYNVLHQSPQVVHRFYTDASRLTRAEAGADGAVDTAGSQTEIHQKVMSLDYGDFKAEIVTVDSQDSLSGGVLVMVTGSLYKKFGGKRNFVQSFFLAPQEKGYFVLNDIFRFVDEEEPKTNRRTAALGNGSPVAPNIEASEESEPSLAVERKGRDGSPASTGEVEPVVEDILEPLDQIDASDASDGLVEDLNQGEPIPVGDEPASSVSTLTAGAPSQLETSEAPKKSYASIVSYASILRMKDSTGSPATSAYNVSPKTVVPAADRAASNTAHSTVASSGGQENFDESSAIENEGSLLAIDGRSVYVRNLPMSISSSQIEEELGKFGLVKPGGVNVKSQKQGVCYAFVEFEEALSAHLAIEASPISIGGRQVYVEEKRPGGPRAGGRGSRLSGVTRGDRSFRSDGPRGRGSLPNRGRGTGPVRGGSSNFVTGSNVIPNTPGTNGSGGDSNRRDAHIGNDNRYARRGGGNNTPRNGALSRGNAPVATV